MNAKDEEGLAPLDCYIKREEGCVFSRKVAMILLENGADVYAKTNDGMTPLI